MLKLSKYYLWILAGFTFIAPCSPAFSQCCSSGSPTGASTFIGLLNKNTLRVISFYRNSFSDVYYNGSVKDTDYAFVKNSSFDYVGLSVGYGLTKKITAEYEMGYFISKIQHYNLTPEYLLKGYGLSNGSILLKYGLLVKPAKNIEITTGTGIKFPFAMQPQYVDNVKLPRDIQPSTGAFGFTSQLFFNKGFLSITLRVFSLNKYEIYGVNSDQYRYGNLMMNSLFISKKICNNFFGIIHIRSDNRQPDRDSKGIAVNSGSEVIFVSPHLSYSISGKWHLDILTDFPVYKNYVGKQLTPKYSFALSLTRDFNNCMSKKTINQK